MHCYEIMIARNLYLSALNSVCRRKEAEFNAAANASEAKYVSSFISRPVGPENITPQPPLICHIVHIMFLSDSGQVEGEESAEYVESAEDVVEVDDEGEVENEGEVVVPEYSNEDRAAK